MSIELQLVLDALDLLKTIISSPDPSGALAKAKQALITDAADAATDAALDAALKAGA